MKAYFLTYDLGNPYGNLALETCLLEQVGRDAENGETVLFLALWKNNNTVVIGKNQDAAAECDLEQMKKSGVLLSRRITGGGAVYHDEGNMNFSFVLPCSLYDNGRTTDIVVSALRKLGVPAEKSGRNDILAEGKKLSGNAYTIKGGAGLHHGTLLISSVPEKVLRLLTPDKYKAQKGKIGSVGSPVTNLKHYLPEITEEQIALALKEAFLQGFGINDFEAEEFVPDPCRLKELTALYSSEEYLFPDTVSGKEIVGYFPWGKITMIFTVTDGKITDFQVLTDSLYTRLWPLVQKAFAGIAFSRQSLCSALDNVLDSITDSGEITALNDIKSLIENTDF